VSGLLILVASAELRGKTKGETTLARRVRESKIVDIFSLL